MNLFFSIVRIAAKAIVSYNKCSSYT